MSLTFSTTCFVKSGNLSEMVREGILAALAHELDEHLFVDGVREFDPHSVDGWHKRQNRLKKAQGL